MKQLSRGISTVAALALAAVLAGCANQPRYSNAQQRYPAQQAPVYQNQADPYGTLYGTVVNIEPVVRAGGASGAGAVVGGVAGGVLGNQVGKGSGRALATIAGVVGGALAGNAIESQSNRGSGGQYYVTIRFDNGDIQTYDVPALGDLRQGNRVRVYQGQITRM